MAPWLWIYPLILALLTGLAIYEHVNTSTLALPVSPVLTILVIFLPVICGLNAGYFPSLVAGANRQGQAFYRQLLPILLQALQLVFTTVLATLFFSDMVPSSVRSCLLDTQWLGFFRAHDADTIRRIQDTFNCCGYNSVRDMAWPFRRGGPGTPQVECTTYYQRSTACRQPWEQSMQRNAGLEFGLVLAVGLLQGLALLFTTLIRSRRGVLWPRTVRRLTGRGEAGTQPLLEEGREDPEVTDDGNEGTGGNDGNETSDGHGRGNGYGGVGPRLEPSRTGQSDHNPWTGGEGSLNT